MRTASFAITGPNDQKAEVAIMSLNRMGGSDLQLVNLWRNTMGLGAVDESQLATMVEPIPIGEDSGTFFKVVDTSVEAEAKQPMRIVVAKVDRGETSWFFKLAGDSALVEQQQEAFRSLLKDLAFQPATPAAPPPAQAGASPTPSTGAPGKPEWEAPTHWQEVPPTTMLLAKFLLTGDSNASAEITVSVFPGDVGGLVANVNRWRGQVGQPAVTESELADLVTSIEVEGGQATIVDVSGTQGSSGQPVRLLGAIIPRGGQTWFFKLMGNATLAEQEKAAFLKFIQSVRYPNA